MVDVDRLIAAAEGLMSEMRTLAHVKSKGYPDDKAQRCYEAALTEWTSVRAAVAAKSKTLRFPDTPTFDVFKCGNCGADQRVERSK